LLNLTGVTDVVRGDATLAQVAQRCGIETLRVVPSGPVPPNPAELLGSDAMAEFLADLRRAADFVLLDTAPVLAVSDALIVTRQTDATLIVVDAGTTTRTAVAHARTQLEQAGAVILGGVLNNLDASTAKTYPSYMRSYYGYGYRARRGDGATPESNGKVKQRAAVPEHIWE
jgi:capsular exopolysaccharide synthesis family protein